MSLALAHGVAVALGDRVPRRCDDCAAVTYVPFHDRDAVWVVCGPCATNGRLVARIEVARRVGAAWARADAGDDPWAFRGGPIA